MDDEGPQLVAALTSMRTAVQDLRLPLDLPGAAEDRRAGARILDHLDDYLLPRVRQMGAPLLAVVGGSTGAGKSTLVNSLVRGRVTAAGVLRPTTRSPVLVHHPDDAAWFRGDRILPTLPRVTGPSAQGRALRLVPHPGVPRGLALLDAPDIDSVVEENRTLGEALLGAADLWVFVTTPARYADAVPWDLLGAAARRRAVVAMVLNRVDDAAATAVEGDLGRMLTEQGLQDARLLAVPESSLRDGLVPERDVGALAAWLRDAVGDPRSREEMVRRAVLGAVGDLLAQAPGLASAADAQLAHVAGLRRAAAESYAEASATLSTATSDGTMLRGEVLARWQEFVGTGEMLRAVEARVSRARDRVAAFFRGRPAPEPVAEAIGSGLVDLVVDAADEAAERAARAWRADPAGRGLLRDLDLSRSSVDLRPRVAEEVRTWQQGVFELVSAEGADRRLTARVLSFGVNGLGAALMVAIFASTGGLTAAELGVAGGSAVLAQRLLEAVFGDDAVRRLTRTAQNDLTGRFDAVLAAETSRFTQALDALDLTPRSADHVRAAVRELELAHRSLHPGELPAHPATGPSAHGPGTTERSPDVVPATGRAEPTLRRWWRQLWGG